VSKDPETQNYILVLEYVKHGSLRSFLDKYNKYLLTSYKVQILKDITKGLNEIHSKGLIHQDIHSGNILNVDFDRIKITDLIISICKNNVRPEIHKDIPESLVDLLNECWDAEPLNRPT